MTNGDWIRNLSNERLARRLHEWVHCDYCPLKKECTAMLNDPSDCFTTWLDWLNKDETVSNQ